MDRPAWLARTARIRRQRRPDEHANWQVWGHPGRGHRPLCRNFLTEQRAPLAEFTIAGAGSNV